MDLIIEVKQQEDLHSAPDFPNTRPEQRPRIMETPVDTGLIGTRVMITKTTHTHKTFGWNCWTLSQYQYAALNEVVVAKQKCESTGQLLDYTKADNLCCYEILIILG